jgi:hypothetical protein
VIGNDCLLMASAHVGHDCSIGDGVILANAVCLAGHVVIGDRAIIGGQSGVRQFVHIGTHAMVGGHSAVDADVIPYGLVKGNRAALHGLNLVGLRRSKVPKDHFAGLMCAYAYLFPSASNFRGTNLTSVVSSEVDGGRSQTQGDTWQGQELQPFLTLSARAEELQRVYTASDEVARDVLRDVDGDGTARAWAGHSPLVGQLLCFLNGDAGSGRGEGGGQRRRRSAVCMPLP